MEPSVNHYMLLESVLKLLKYQIAWQTNHTVEKHGHYLAVGLRNGNEREFTFLPHHLHRLSVILKTANRTFIFLVDIIGPIS